MTTSREQGAYTEDLACQFLKEKGLKLIERNFSCRLGEIDIIMQDNNYLVFVEVRYRKNNNFGSGAESVTYSKQQKLIKAASWYLQKNSKSNNLPARFDVVAITGPIEGDDLKTIDFNWVSNAFEA